MEVKNKIMYHYHKKGIYDELWDTCKEIIVDENFRSYYSTILDNFTTGISYRDNEFYSLDKIIDICLQNNIFEMFMDIDVIGKLIGNTPMIKINCVHNGVKKSIYTKLEWYNFSGSIKDRAAFYILKEAKRKGILKDGQPIVEATSGNMGISIAAIGGALGHTVHIFISAEMISHFCLNI